MASDEEKDTFYNQLWDVLQEILSFTVVLGDSNNVTI